MSLRPSNDCTAAVRGAYDADYVRSLLYCRDALHGDDRESGEAAYAGQVSPPDSVWPHIRDIWSSETTEGKPRRLLVNAFAHLAKARNGLVLPRYPQAPAEVEEARRAYFERRATDGDWDAAFDELFLTGEELGVGCLRLGMRDAGEDQYLDCEPVSPLHVLWDPLKPNPTRSAWVAFSLLLSIEEGRERFGRKKADDAARGEDGARFVRVVEYWDAGVPGRDPTFCAWLGDAEGAPAEHRENPYGIVPAAFYVQYLPPGSVRPIGRVSMQLATEARRQILEEMIRRAAEMPPMSAIDRSLLEEDVVQRMRKGEFPSRFLFDSSKLDGVRAPVVRIPPAELNGVLYQELVALRAQQDAEASTNDYERGVIAPGDRTAREVDEIAQSAQRQGSWTIKQLGKTYQRFYTVAGTMAATHDTLPTTVDVRGADVTLNDPKDPDSWLEAMFEDASRVTIEDESLFSGGTIRKRMEEAMKLDQLKAFAGPPGSGAPIDLFKLVAKISTALLGTNASDLMNPVPAPARPPVSPAPAALRPGVLPPGAGV